MGSLGNTTRCDRDMLGPKTPEQSQPGSFMPEDNENVARHHTLDH
jgi:hypothetical protein